MRERQHFTWDGSAQAIERLAAANRRATHEWLRSLSTAESIEIFESLCEGIPELDVAREAPAPGLALFRIWRA